MKRILLFSLLSTLLLTSCMAVQVVGSVAGGAVMVSGYALGANAVTKKVKKKKDKKKKVICVSTQVVEAGVNFSFGCVIRSMAGLDNIIQAAGRCNRHKELGRMGVVYIVQMSSKAENLKHLDEIKNAQAALQKVLDDFDLNRERFDNTLDLSLIHI